MIYQGSCHCGQIRFEADGEIGPLVECNCSYCSRKGYLLWFLGREQLRLLTPDDDLSTYTFNQHVIKHHFCPTCGCGPFGFGVDPSGKPMAAVNVRCLEGIELSDLERVPYDGRNA